LTIDIYREDKLFGVGSAVKSTSQSAKSEAIVAVGNDGVSAIIPEDEENKKADLIDEKEEQQDQQQQIQPKEESKPFFSVQAHKMVVSWYSKYLFKMLTSQLREGGENRIRLTTVYPESLRILLGSFYDHVLEIRSAEELIEMFYLADEYDVPNVMTALKQIFTPLSSDGSALQAANSSPESSLEINLANAPMFLACSANIGLKLELSIFSGLARQWKYFAPRSYDEETGYSWQRRNSMLLLESLNFED
jgi:hypothetical protein